ncbi:trypsin-like cysteine/serine peptidase domain-containing protein [Paraphoma chrysanthemicola]|uniref:Trypsin-like cysteine/serine peptidase domain-containing protein n=1 Tax=Paraphoma chrysanthemicola TaxID=798071 RepID=A0A8K0W071_9PLEO|nr:trypsin-like cysteine/serine peptidase domain-containing protein [Paraphoma chrysanthemicola]
MHAKSILVALAAPALIYGAAIPQDDPFGWDENSEDIVGGVAAATGDFPFIVSVALSGSHFCGGTLLNANTVISAAHCYFGRTSSSWSIRAGSLNRGSGGVVSTVNSIRIHPSYNDDTSDYDVAILKLATPVATSSTIGYATVAAANSDPAAGSTVTTAGWGNTSEDGSSPALLRKVDVPVVSRATCRNNYSAAAITDRMFCAGLAAGGRDSCQGDSGGPIVSSSKVLLGVVSWGFGCAQPNFPGVYSRLGALTPFITSNL